MKSMSKKTWMIIIILIILVAGILMYSFHLMGKVNNVEISDDNEALGIKEEVIEKEDQKSRQAEIINIALFGLDKRGDTEIARSDSIMIASFNQEYKNLKLTSIMRDTYVDIPGIGMDKINHAYAFGGPELAIKTINQNFNMNIRDFITVDFGGLEQIIDTLGGVEIEVKENETAYVPGSVAGVQLLNGKQALAYSRIRKTGDGDFERTARQRMIMQKVISQGLGVEMTQYPALLNTILHYVETSLSRNEILKYGTTIVGADISEVEQFRLPVDQYAQEKMINGIYYLIPTTLEDNIKLLYEFIYGQ